MNELSNKIIIEDMKKIFSANIDWNRINGKTIFVTGATGMLATYIIYFLIYLNEKIENFNVNIIAGIRNKEKCIKKFGKYIDKKYFNYYLGDINREIDIKQKVDFIIHAASIAMTEYYSVYPIDVILPNVIGTNNLLDFAEKNNSDSFLFFSSDVIYGKIDENKDVKEDDYGKIDTLNINSCYAESKRLGETLCRAYFKQKNVNTKIVRISHTYGPTIDLENDHRVFAEFIKNIINNQNIIMKSDGNAIRSFCYLSDATEAFFRILLDGKKGEAYNMCNTDCRISIKELADILVRLFPEKNLRVEQRAREKSDNYIENKFVVNSTISNEKLKSLGWKPQFNIEEGFSRTIKSYMEK